MTDEIEVRVLERQPNNINLIKLIMKITKILLTILLITLSTNAQAYHRDLGRDDRMSTLFDKRGEYKFNKMYGMDTASGIPNVYGSPYIYRTPVYSPYGY